MSEQENSNRTMVGQVVSDAMDKSITVSVERRFKHPLLHKTVRKSKKYRAHDEKDAFKVGDQVRIQECAPKSKTKRWEVIAE